MLTSKRALAGVTALLISLVIGGCDIVPDESPRNVAQGILVAPVSRSTICHATGTWALPYVEIAISDEAVSRHRDHVDDLIPAPAGGCPQALGGPANPDQSLPVGIATTGEEPERVDGCSPEDQTAAQFIQVTDHLSHFEMLLNETGWLRLLDGQVVITAFVPSDDAFERLTSREQGAMFNDEGSRNAVIMYHLVLGQWTVSELADQSLLEMLSGELLHLGEKDGALTLNNNTTVTEADIPLCNGIVHVIDNILVPPIFLDRRGVTPTTTPQDREDREPTIIPTATFPPSFPQSGTRTGGSSVRPTLTPLPPQPSPTPQPTRTPVPAPTATDVPAPTDPPAPPPTATEVPVPTDTPAPPPTEPPPLATDTPDGGTTTTGTTTTGGTSDGGTTDGTTTGGDTGGTSDGSTTGGTTGSGTTTTDGGSTTGGGTTGTGGGTINGGSTNGGRNAGGTTARLQHTVQTLAQWLANWIGMGILSVIHPFG